MIWLVDLAAKMLLVSGWFPDQNGPDELLHAVSGLANWVAGSSHHITVPELLVTWWSQSEIRNFFYEKSNSANRDHFLRVEQSLLDELSPSLRTKVALIVNKRVIENVPFFWNCIPLFVTEIIMLMKPAYYAPFEFVVEENDLADRLYIINSGSVDIIKWGSYRITRLQSGSFFGEMAFLGSHVYHAKQAFSPILCRKQPKLQAPKCISTHSVLHWCSRVAL